MSDLLTLRQQNSLRSSGQVTFRSGALHTPNCEVKFGLQLASSTWNGFLGYLRGTKECFRDSQPALSNLTESTWHQLGNVQKGCNSHLCLSSAGLAAGGVTEESNAVDLELLG